METQLTTIRDQQKETWNKFSDGWKKWDDFTMTFLRPMGDAIINSLFIQNTDIVLDIASGTGEPALTIAQRAKKVIGTDIADKMLEIARENATERKIRNIEFKVADITELPFENMYFDKISCRMGFMFFPDMQLAANEMFRVCKTGGKIATSVWSEPEMNPWITTMTKILSKNIDLPPTDPMAPGMFRCAKPGMVKNFLETAGFKNVQEKTIAGKVNFNVPSNYWRNMTEIVAPVVGALSKVDDATRLKIQGEVIAACEQLAKNGKLELDYASIIISGDK